MQEQADLDIAPPQVVEQLTASRGVEIE